MPESAEESQEAPPFLKNTKDYPDLLSDPCKEYTKYENIFTLIEKIWVDTGNGEEDSLETFEKHVDFLDKVLYMAFDTMNFQRLNPNWRDK